MANRLDTVSANNSLSPPAAPTERIFYDGNCGLCHFAVSFILKRDRDGSKFRFAPLDSDLFRSITSETERTRLGETLVLQTADGAILVRSRAVVHIMRRLGGIWRVLAGMLRVLPVAVGDRLYDIVAWSRHRLFRRPAQVCPMLPSHLRQRFDF